MTAEREKRPPRYLSGIQPSGQLHLGNYFGAIRQHIELQDKGEAFYFLANYHALTTIHDAELLERYTLEAAATYLALGLDPERAVFFRQSDVPEVCELMWLLLTATPMGELERAHSYKDKIARGIKPSAGLFTYPVLMAADILAYDATIVPVGRDQLQHIEMTREMARAFNHQYGRRVFVLPEARLSEAPQVPGLDGQKMSKSYDNHIPIFLEGKALRRRVGRIVTDSRPLGTPLDPESCTVFRLYSLFADEEERAEMERLYREGRIGYGEAKKRLAEKIETTFAPARARYREWLEHPERLAAVLEQGAEKARRVAREVTHRARAACGVD